MAFLLDTMGNQGSVVLKNQEHSTFASRVRQLGTISPERNHEYDDSIEEVSA
jgi:hypothetical protein